MKISFLIYNLYGIGGTIRSTVNLSAALAAAGHTVEIASVYRTAAEPALALGPGVTVRPLIEWRRGEPGCARRTLAAQRPSSMWQDSGVAFGPLAPSRLTDERVQSHLRRTDADVVIATRPLLNGYLARYGDPRCLRIGQEHLTLEMHNEQQRADQNRALAELDAFVTVSEADAAHYRAALPDVTTRITCIPNAVPRPRVRRVTGNTRTIVAAGRLAKVKRYDRLIDAFARVAPDYPDWSLRIYGRGKQAGALRRQIDRLGLYDRVRLMGAVSPIETEWAKGELAAVSSDNEAFGMTIVEAMHCGLPVVATDCPYGPGEIISSGTDGLLVPLSGGADALADALWILMGSRERREAMSARAGQKAARYVPELVGQRYLDLFEELGAPRAAVPQQSADGVGAVRRLREAFRRGLPAAVPRVRRAPREELAPIADCVVAPDGSPVFGLDTDRLPSGHWDLLLRRRKDSGHEDVRLPLPPRSEAREGRLDVVLDRDGHRLAEGRWDLYLAPAKRPGRAEKQGRRLRIESGVVEQGELLALPLRSDPEGVSHWIPYGTVEGNLTLRTWLRPAHAEVDRVHLAADGTGAGRADGTTDGWVAEATGGSVGGTGSETLTVVLRLYGAARDAARPRVRAVPRDSDVLAVDCPTAWLSDSEHPGGEVVFTLPLRALLAQWEGERTLWDLEFTAEPGAEPVLVSRVRGDAADRKETDVIPPARIRDTRLPARIRPYYTLRNELALVVRALDVAAQAPSARTTGESGHPTAA
ncbi:glycosyltransferase family 4 protein [Streptomyces sp. XM4193]|uniref:glycosyltransferase family 4 protein n=1 Tax=Streptomyces sp. XM4193 TaxID=2929782 RepID=UPI001FF8DC2A|nr:glycosyltransferase family 4 protein [Streptomyces sp. XM4193]MCK1795776.1 glycosyltransferase family 4 protein [Streptomyces sp. XM4193]